MKKPFKVLSTVAMASALSVSALTPVIAADTAEPTVADYKVQAIIFLDGDKLASLPVGKYNIAYGLQQLKDTVKYVQYPDGTVYDVTKYNIAYGLAKGNEQKVKENLEAQQEAVQDKVYEGYIDENGKVRAKADEQPEDRLNETFFYNAA